MRYPKTVNTLACLIARPLSEARARGKRTAPLGGRRGRRNRSQRGMTLLELIVASFVLLILASAALPVVRVTIVRSKEAQLHKALREIRDLFTGLPLEIVFPAEQFLERLPEDVGGGRPSQWPGWF